MQNQQEPWLPGTATDNSSTEDKTNSLTLKETSQKRRVRTLSNRSNGNNMCIVLHACMHVLCVVMACMCYEGM